MHNRREFLQRMTQGAALAGTGGLLWAYLLRQEVRAQPFALRPPGALAEADFNATCIKCGQCVNACPPHILNLATAGGSLPIGMPAYEPRTGPCVMCPDIPCVKNCPTGALNPGLTNIADARMGLAVIDSENCLSWKGLRCEICHRDCPLKGKAITVDPHPRLTSKHAVFVPVVHSDACTGCGICVKACPTAEPAIRILPARLVQGKIGDHYRLNGTGETAITQDFKPAPPPPPEAIPAKPGGLDVLNSGL